MLIIGHQRRLCVDANKIIVEANNHVKTCFHLKVTNNVIFFLLSMLFHNDIFKLRFYLNRILPILIE